jgi:hypothetical protein
MLNGVALAISNPVVTTDELFLYYVFETRSMTVPQVILAVVTSKVCR